MTTFKAISFFEKAFLVFLFVIFGGIVLHAPFIVGMETLFPDYELLAKSWKEILLIISSVIAFGIIIKKKKWRLFHNPIVVIAISYGVLHILMLPFLWNGLLPSLAGLMVDLRFVLFFLLVYLALQLYPWVRGIFLKVGLVGAAIVVCFAALQVLVLPPDVLTYIGYGSDTIAPYLTVDKNPDYIRVSSTLRGPNPLGAYVVVIISLISAFAFRKINVIRSRQVNFGLGALFVLSLVALWFTYSRSAVVAAIVAFIIVFALTIARKLPKWAWVASATVLFALIGGLIIGRDSHFVSNVLLHENPVGGSEISSNDGHVESLIDGTNRLLRQPFGAGVGSTGSASLLGDSPLVIENQYLFTAHEVGWIGLALFILLFVIILKHLWQRRSDWLSLGVFASGIGLALIGLLLPVWVDDTVAIIWWGLAAVALATQGVKNE